MVFFEVAGLPAQMWQMAGKINGMLSGAAADLQDITGSGKCFSQNCEDGIPVLFAGLGILFYDDFLLQNSAPGQPDPDWPGIRIRN